MKTATMGTAKMIPMCYQILELEQLRQSMNMEPAFVFVCIMIVRWQPKESMTIAEAVCATLDGPLQQFGSLQKPFNQ